MHEITSLQLGFGVQSTISRALTFTLQFSRTKPHFNSPFEAVFLDCRWWHLSHQGLGFNSWTLFIIHCYGAICFIKVNAASWAQRDVRSNWNAALIAHLPNLLTCKASAEVHTPKDRPAPGGESLMFSPAGGQLTVCPPEGCPPSCQLFYCCEINMFNSINFSYISNN